MILSGRRLGGGGGGYRRKLDSKRLDRGAGILREKGLGSSLVVVAGSRGTAVTDRKRDRENIMRVSLNSPLPGDGGEVFVVIEERWM